MKVFSIKALFFLVSLFCYETLMAQVIVVNNQRLPAKEFLLAAYKNHGLKSMKTVMSDEKGFALFSPDTLESGLYYLLFPDSSSIEFMIDVNYLEKISISIDNMGKYNITGSRLTEAYNNFLRDLDSIAQQGNKNVINGFYTEGSNNIKVQVNALIDKSINQFPSTFLASYLSSLKNIEIPKYIPPAGIVRKDSAIWQHQLSYFQEHFLDNLNLSDIRLTRTPVYTDLIDKYLERIVRQNPIDLTNGVDTLVKKSSRSSETMEFVIRYIFDKYYSKVYSAINEFVILHIIENYIFKTGCTWLSENEQLSITKEYNKRKPASLLQIAPTIVLPDENSVIRNMNEIEANFTILFFYSCDCPMCSKAIPDLRKTMSMFSYLNLKVCAISVGGDVEEWKNYITKNKITHWINLSDPANIADVVRNYNLTLTPAIFLLDKTKVIISKNITIAQLNDFLLKEAINQGKK